MSIDYSWVRKIHGLCGSDNDTCGGAASHDTSLEKLRRSHTSSPLCEWGMVAQPPSRWITGPLWAHFMPLSPLRSPTRSPTAWMRMRWLPLVRVWVPPALPGAITFLPPPRRTSPCLKTPATVPRLCCAGQTCARWGRTHRFQDKRCVPPPSQHGLQPTSPRTKLGHFCASPGQGLHLDPEAS
jgi:hypothetical protein